MEIHGATATRTKEHRGQGEIVLEHEHSQLEEPYGINIWRSIQKDQSEELCFHRQQAFWAAIGNNHTQLWMQQSKSLLLHVAPCLLCTWLPDWPTIVPSIKKFQNIRVCGVNDAWTIWKAIHSQEILYSPKLWSVDEEIAGRGISRVSKESCQRYMPADSVQSHSGLRLDVRISVSSRLPSQLSPWVEGDRQKHQYRHHRQ